LKRTQARTDAHDVICDDIRTIPACGMVKKVIVKKLAKFGDAIADAKEVQESNNQAR
jgi:hypothetical protein